MDKALQTMIDNMPEKTGKSLEQWVVLLSKQSFEKHSTAVKFLKTEHGVTHGFANTIVTLAKDNSQENEIDLLQQQYVGKESLTPIYKKLLSIISDFGNDIEVVPKKGSVSFIRKRQFALIKPATKTRIDLGLKLKGIEVQGCLEGSGPFGTMCTHRIQIKNIEDVNDEVIKWLLTSYELSV